MGTPTIPDQAQDIAYTATGTGAVLRTTQAKLDERVSVTDFGAVGDGTTDNTTAVQKAIDALMGAAGTGPGGTICFPAGRYLVTGQLVIRHSSTSPYFPQPYLRLTGAGHNADGQWAALDSAATILDLRVDAAVAKIDTRGKGVLEIDHLLLKDGGTSAAAFIQTTSTTLHIHHAAFSGTGFGGSAVNDAIILGGTSNDIGTSAADSCFQGYGTVIDSCWFDQIRRAVLFQSAANGVQVVNNTVSNSCGSAEADGAPFRVAHVGLGARGNFFSGNLVEMYYYAYAFFCGGNSNVFIGNTTWDAGVGTLGSYRLTGGGNIVLPGNDDYPASDAITGARSNLFLPTNLGSMYCNIPVVCTPILKPVIDVQRPANGATVPINNTTAVMRVIIAQTGVTSLTIDAATQNDGATGQWCKIRFVNSSGAPLNVTWDASWKLNSTWTPIPDQSNRDIDFYFDGSNWNETSHTTDRVDLANAQTITGQKTFAAGVILPSADPHVAGAWWDNAGVLTKSSG